MTDREKVITEIEDALSGNLAKAGNVYRMSLNDLKDKALKDALDLLKEQREIKEQFIEVFNTIRDAYNVPANREKILLDYLMRNACCCEQKLLIDSGQFADMPTIQSAT